MDALYVGGNAVTAEDRLESLHSINDLPEKNRLVEAFDAIPWSETACGEPGVSTGEFPGRGPRDSAGPEPILQPLPIARLQHPDDCLWAVTIDNRAVGMVSILHAGPHVVRINSFRIHPDWQHTPVLAKLIDRVYRHCWNRGYLKVVLESQGAPAIVRKMFEHRGFHLVRRRHVLGKELLDYYVDLYSPPQHETQ